MIKQWLSTNNGKSPNANVLPTIQVQLPVPEQFDTLLHWLYHHDATVLNKSLEEDSPNAFFGLVRNAVQLAILPAAGLWDALASHVAQQWPRVYRNHPKWTFTIIPVSLVARAAIAIGGGAPGGDLVGLWANGNVDVAKRGVEEVRRLLHAYREPTDTDATIVAEESASAHSEPLPQQQEKIKKEKKSLLKKFTALLVKEEDVHIATVVVVRDKNGEVVDEKVIMHEK
ncbi:uncharacterized protein SPPG_01413 [Spizellomyces punctatus DAOM BR117]|uniref:Uncharacterized protein n=1 Tax=Spizellomyces punctatus (strain DAOM BR117) TaxID=645134 RepID=A0A0L0HSA4_SPIPD|nr:uncharacterized protein SPPG_01413 [Spizellomyces punctatus DAOM BR117]KND03962.1 hypothetical protein SPPG_01413 [Spizellomyces punctatus DAOM BR117]|eukprot:XP_016612001.1 hypothetical protein SPPG_01413 [Spizellomyces punctatus DAOM BR117]